MLSATFLALALGIAFAVYKICQIGRREGYLPPGPPTLPLLGNLHIFPRAFAHFQYVPMYSHSTFSTFALITHLDLLPGLVSMETYTISK